MKTSDIKVIKINSLGCPSCIIMNNVFNKIKNEYSFEFEELDFDFDDIEKYNVGKILPVFIFMKDDKEINRLIGEHSIEEFRSLFEE